MCLVNITFSGGGRVVTLENYKVRSILAFPAKGLSGRRKIFTNVREITAENVVEVLNRALAVHSMNAAEITYLYQFYKGIQDIRHKKKFVRENINHKVTVNRANEIVTFKSSYLLNEQLQYISHGGDDTTSQKVNTLNEYMRAESKAARDKEIVDWFHICGVAERFVDTDKEAGERDGAPYNLYTLDPREAFVIYSAKIGEKPMAGIILQYDDNDRLYANIYTGTRMFEVHDGQVTRDDPHIMGGIPLVEYVNNDARMGAFEIVIPILNSINQLESDAVDSVQDFVNGFDVFQNCEIEDGSYSQLAIGGKAVKIKTVVQGVEAKVYRVASELSQDGVQERIDDLTDAYLEICGMPNRNGGSSTSDTGVAVLFRDGWSAADARAKDTEVLFKRSEREFDRIVLNICSSRPGGLDLKLSEFELDFPRGNLNNMQSKVQVLCEMLNNPKIHPKYAFTLSNIFDDAEEAYRVSSEYYEEYQKEQDQKIQEELDRERERIKNNADRGDAGTVSSGGSDGQSTEQTGTEKSGAA